MFSYKDWKRKRYAEDPEFRERTRAYNRAYHAAHKDEINALRRRKWVEDPRRKEQHRRYRRKTRRKDTLKYYYGISPDDYDRLFARQRGSCAICRERPAKTLCIDHCHATGKVRGLLCRRCNLGLGHLDDSPSLVSAALAYLAGSHDAALAYLAGSRDYEQA